MSNLTNTNRDYKQQREIQSFYEPALNILEEVMERKRLNLRAKKYDEKNAAVSKDELSEIYARYFRITQYTALEIINSLIRAGKVESLVGFVKPKAGEV